MSSVASVYFNGGAIYSGPSPSLILSGSFTIEFWFNCGNQPNQWHSAIGQNSHAAGGMDIRINGQMQLLPNSGSPLSIYNSARTNLNDNQWHNVAIVQNVTNNTLTVFIDGVQDGQNNNIYTWNFGTYGISLGLNPGYSSTWVGYLSNIRILNGTALYSSNYTVPTSTYTAIPNTVFLFNANYPNSYIDSSPYNLSLTRSGSPLPVSSLIAPNLTLSPQNSNMIACFKEGTKILCLIENLEVYVPIQNIKPGFLVKTFSSGYKAVNMIGSRKIFNPANNLRYKDRLYHLTQLAYPALFEDLWLTGCHSILVDNLNLKERESTIQDIGKIMITENKYRLFTYLDEWATPYEKEGIFTIWHICLENDDYYMNYGIYANGLLVESISQRMMKEYSGMELVKY